MCDNFVRYVSTRAYGHWLKASLPHKSYKLGIRLGRDFERRKEDKEQTMRATASCRVICKRSVERSCRQEPRMNNVLRAFMLHYLRSIHSKQSMGNNNSIKGNAHRNHVWDSV